MKKNPSLEETEVARLRMETVRVKELTRSRSLEAAAQVVLNTEHPLFDSVDPSDRDEYLDYLANRIRELSEGDIDRILAEEDDD